MPPTSSQIYDQFALYYRHYSERKSRYLDAVNGLIVSRAGQHKRVLDIGCGDGVRGVQVAKIIKSAKLLMLDNSEGMVSLASKFQDKNITVLKLDIADKKSVFELGQDNFDTIFCLWNVFGHIIPEQNRLQALANIRDILTGEGLLFVDVSNRYNVAHYGIKSVAVNMWNDFVHPDRDNGTFSYAIDIGTEKIKSHCHFFNPNEFPKLCKKAGLQVKETIYLNYATGAVTNHFSGHAFHVVKKKTHR